MFIHRKYKAVVANLVTFLSALHTLS